MFDCNDINEWRMISIGLKPIWQYRPVNPFEHKHCPWSSHCWHRLEHIFFSHLLPVHPWWHWHMSWLSFEHVPYWPQSIEHIPVRNDTLFDMFISVMDITLRTVRSCPVTFADAHRLRIINILSMIRTSITITLRIDQCWTILIGISMKTLTFTIETNTMMTTIEISTGN
jgi:hypothetical protein